MQPHRRFLAAGDTGDHGVEAPGLGHRHQLLHEPLAASRKPNFAYTRNPQQIPHNSPIGEQEPWLWAQVESISSYLYILRVAWEIKATAQVKSWQASLDEEERRSFIAAVELLREGGPTLGRPIVERIHSSRYQNMKELRPLGAGRDLRILFMFDPRRQAILLFGGSKAGQWNDWYRRAIPEAERLYDQYLADLPDP